ncbi:MAG: toxin-activating lysine-acyltransferase [Sulfitobacter sp.]
MSDETTQDKFLQASLRHLNALRNAQGDAVMPFPQGWFDLPDRQLADLGAMFFLISMSSYHKNRPLAQVFSTLETPLRLSQYRIFRSDGFPRAFFTWAGLDHSTERQFAVEHAPLRKEQWNSGASLWVVDLSAPFGHLDQVITMMAANRQTNRVRTLWHNRAGTRARVIEWNRQNADGEIAVTSYGQNQFIQQLDREA